MHDDFHSPAWAEHHGQLSTAIHKLLAGMGQSMEVLNRLQFSAPWREQPCRDPRAGR